MNRTPHDPSLTRTVLKGVLRALLAVLLLVCAAVWLLGFSNWPIIRSTYKAVDYDTRLTRYAKTATVAMAALECFHRDHAAYPADTTALAPYLGSVRRTPKAPEIAGWYYTPEPDGSGYTLARKLGWDACLLYEFDGARGRWVFSPGDGGTDKIIQLKP